MKNFEYKKSLGQNFLKDRAVINKIVDAADMKENNLVIEIGPGAGSLSTELVKKFDKVLMYEIDTRLKSILEEELQSYDNYEVIFADFLERNVLEDLEKYKFDNLYIVANLPYYVTTPILFKIIKDNIPVKEVIVMIQKEVAERISSMPSTKEYGQLSVFLQYFFEIRKVCNVSKNSFVPRPKVDSSVIKMKKRENLLYLKDFNTFEKLVRDSFRFKRKTIKNNLCDYDLEKVNNVLSKYGLNANNRSEELSYEVFVDLANELIN